MYDNLSSRLRGEAEASDASPYIKELMKQAADALDHFENLARTLQSLSAAPTIIPAEEGERWHILRLDISFAVALKKSVTKIAHLIKNSRIRKPTPTESVP